MKTRYAMMMLLALVLAAVFAAAASARTPAEMEAEAQRLEQRVSGTTDLNALMQMAGEAQELLQEAAGAAAAATGMPNISIKPAATPEKEIERRREIINAQFAQFRKMVGVRAQADEQAPIPEAVAVEGRIVVEGGETANETRGVIPMDLRYTVEEKFVGNLLILHLYDAKKGRFAKDKEYGLHSFSTGIRVVGAGGRKCVGWTSTLPGTCTRWAQYGPSKVEPGERYPQFYAGVLGAVTEEGKVELKAEAPTILFPSVPPGATAKLGCFNAKWEMTTKEFEKLLDRSEIVLKKDIGRPVGPSPGCRPGSTMTLHLKVKGRDCAIEVEGDENLIDDCMGEDGMAPPLRLKAVRGTGAASTAKWRIAEGADKAKFLEGAAPQRPKVNLRATGPSQTEDDIAVEAEIPGKGGQVCVARHTFTSRRPRELRRLTDPESLAVGITPFVSFKKLCQTSGCIKPDVPAPGREHLDVIDGYRRISANEVLDQFDRPIRRDGLIWYEDRKAKVGSRTIEIEQASEGGGGTDVPINPSQPNGETMKMLSNDGTLEKGGLVVDYLWSMYLSDSSGVPEGYDITVDQNIKILACPVAKCVQHYMKTDATHVCKPPAR